MSGEVRIIHKTNPARPKDPMGIIEVEVSGQKVRMPNKGHDKVIRVKMVQFEIHDEVSKESQNL